MSNPNEKTHDLIQSILTGIKTIMQANANGIPDQVQSQVNSELKSIDSQVYGVVDLLEEGEE